MDNFNFLNSMKRGFIPLLGVLLPLLMTQMSVAQTIDVSTLTATVTYPTWAYDDATKELALITPNVNYTLTGTNNDLHVNVTGSNANILLDGVNITCSAGTAWNVDADCSISLTGTNSSIKKLGNAGRGLSISANMSCEINASPGITLTVEGYCGIYLNADAVLIIDGEGEITTVGYDIGLFCDIGSITNVGQDVTLYTIYQPIPSSGSGIRTASAGAVTLNIDGTLIATGIYAGEGILAYNDLTVTGNGTVNATGLDMNGIYVGGTFTVEDCHITASSNMSRSIGTPNTIRMNDDAKITMNHGTGGAETHTFERTNAASTHIWKLTNATTSDPLTDPSISVAVAAGATGTVERATGAPTLTNPTNIAITAGQNASFSVTATGTPAPTLRWQESTDGGTTWSNISNGGIYSNATTATLSLTAVPIANNGYQYRCTATNGISPDATSAAATLTVSAAPTLTNPTNIAITAGQNASFSVTATGTPAPTLQWQESTDGGTTWSNISNGGIYSDATTTTLTLTAVPIANDGYQYHCTATNGTLPDATSAAATLTVSAATVAPTLTNPSNIAITAGQNASFSVTATGTPAPTLQWQESTDGGTTWSNISNGGIYSDATTATLTLTAVPIANNGYQYRCTATNGTSPDATSAAATLTVTAAVSAPTLSGPTSMTLTVGYAATSTAAYTIGGTAPVTVTATSSNPAITWNSVTERIDIAAGLGTGTYTVALTANNGTLPDATLNFTLTVSSPPTPPTGTAPRITGPATMTLTVDYDATSTSPFTITGTSPVTVSKTKGDSHITWNNSAKTLDIAAGLTAGTYEVELTASNSIGTFRFTFTLTVEAEMFYLDFPTSFEGGTVEVETEVPYLATEGETVTLIITPDPGYELESVTVSGYGDESIVVPVNCTGNVCTFIMPGHHVSISVTFTNTATGNVETWHAASLQVWTVNSVLHVSGLTVGNGWSVYNILGTLVYQGVASAEKAEIALPARGVYIVADGKTVVKVNH